MSDNKSVKELEATIASIRQRIARLSAADDYGNTVAAARTTLARMEEELRIVRSGESPTNRAQLVEELRGAITQIKEQIRQNEELGYEVHSCGFGLDLLERCLAELGEDET